MPTVDVLERVLTKGIVIAYDAAVSVVGLPVIEVDGHATVTSLETQVHIAEPPAPQVEAGETSEALLAAVTEYISRLSSPSLPSEAPDPGS